MTRTKHAFTLIELLVVIAIIAILAALFGTGLARAKSSARLAQCTNHKRQLTVAWTLYATDNEARLPLNPLDNFGDLWAPSDMQAWTGDVQDWDVWSQTNIAYMISPVYASMAKYSSEPLIYTCPADRFVSPEQKAAGVRHRIRNVSMNLAMGVGQSPGSALGTKKYLSFADIRKPAHRFVFIDEHPDTIEYGYFFVPVNRGWGLYDWPGSFHNGGATLSFADSHVEFKRWKLAETRRPVLYLQGATWPTEQKDDFLWLLDRTGEPYF